MRARDNCNFFFRWTIFSYMISPELDPQSLRNLADPSFIFPVCQLFMTQHDWKEPVLYDWEVQLFLLEHLRFQV